MFLHLSVGHSAHNRGCLPQCMLGYQPLWADTPPGQTLPGRSPRQTAPCQTPPKQTSPWAETPLPSACWDTQCPVHAGIDMASAADGTHPIGMHSYLADVFPKTA